MNYPIAKQTAVEGHRYSKCGRRWRFEVVLFLCGQRLSPSASMVPYQCACTRCLDICRVEHEEYPLRVRSRLFRWSKG